MLPDTETTDAHSTDALSTDTSTTDAFATDAFTTDTFATDTLTTDSFTTDTASVDPGSPQSQVRATAPPPGMPPDPSDVLASLGKRFRGPVLKMQFELRTSYTRQIFRRDFVYVSQQLHALEASRRVHGLPREKLRQALAGVASSVEAARQRLLELASQMRGLIALSGQSDADVQFSRPSLIQATIVSPFARDFMGLLELADDALTQLERAWLLGLIELPERGQLLTECRKAVQAVKETVREQRHVIGTLVREVNARRARDIGVDAAGVSPAIEKGSTPSADDPPKAGESLPTWASCASRPSHPPELMAREPGDNMPYRGCCTAS